MAKEKAEQVLRAARRAEPKKKRVTFFISKAGKDALAAWCAQNGISESGAVEQMIRLTVPIRYFKGEA